MPRQQNRLRRYRKARGLTQPQVARILGLKTSSAISRWERGERTPTIARLLELSALYRRLVNDLLRPQYFTARTRVATRLKKLNMS